MKSEEINTGTEDPKENDVIFAPIEHIRDIENVINKLEITHRELQKVAEGMKLIKN